MKINNTGKMLASILQFCNHNKIQYHQIAITLKYYTDNVQSNIERMKTLIVLKFLNTLKSRIF